MLQIDRDGRRLLHGLREPLNRQIPGFAPEERGEAFAWSGPESVETSRSCSFSGYLGFARGPLLATAPLRDVEPQSLVFWGAPCAARFPSA